MTSRNTDRTLPPDVWVSERQHAAYGAHVAVQVVEHSPVRHVHELVDDGRDVAMQLVELDRARIPLAHLQRAAVGAVGGGAARRVGAVGGIADALDVREQPVEASEETYGARAVFERQIEQVAQRQHVVVREARRRLVAPPAAARRRRRRRRRRGVRRRQRLRYRFADRIRHFVIVVVVAAVVVVVGVVGHSCVPRLVSRRRRRAVRLPDRFGRRTQGCGGGRLGGAGQRRLVELAQPVVDGAHERPLRVVLAGGRGGGGGGRRWVRLHVFGGGRRGDVPLHGHCAPKHEVRTNGVSTRTSGLE